MGAHRDDLETVADQHADVDAAIVIAVDDHRVAVWSAANCWQQDVREAFQREAVLDLHRREHVRREILDHLCGVPGRERVHRADLQLHPPEPVVTPARGDLDLASDMPHQQTPTVLAQDHERAAVVRRCEAQPAEQAHDLALVRIAVRGLAEDPVDLALQREHLPPGVRVGRLECPRALEEVLDVERCDPHA